MPEPSLVFRAVWPVLDDERTMRDLRIEATAALPDLLFDASVQQLGPLTITCDTLTRAEVCHLLGCSEGKAIARGIPATGFYLVGECAAGPWHDDLRRTRRGYERATA